MKRFYLLIFCAALIIGIIAGCSGSEETQSTNNNGTPTDEVTIWGWDVAAEAMEVAVSKFNEKYPDVKVTVVNNGSDEVYEKLTVGLAANGTGLPDIVMLEEEQIPSYTTMFPNGFANLSEMGFEEHVDKFSPSKINTAQNDRGDLVAAPWDVGPAGIFYRVDYFEKAGVDPDSIETWDDYIEAGKKIKKATGAQMMPIDISKNDVIFQMMMNQQGMMYFDENNELVISSDEALNAMSTIKELHDNELVANVEGWNGIVTATVNGSVATVPYGVWYSGTIKDQAPDLAGKWGVFYLPAFEEGGNRYANLGGSSLLIPESSKNKDAAYAFLEFFTTDVDIQMTSFKEYGLFPSLLETYEDPFFDEELAFFNNQKMNRLFADAVPNVPAVNFTEHFSRASRGVANAQASILLENKSVEDELKKAEETIGNEIK